MKIVKNLSKKMRPSEVAQRKADSNNIKAWRSLNDVGLIQQRESISKTPPSKNVVAAREARPIHPLSSCVDDWGRIAHTLAIID